MPSRRLGIMIAVVLVSSTSPTLARSYQGDMFNNKGWTTERPRVPSDEARGSDMFPTNGFVVNPRADLFGSVRPNFDFGRNDMFVVRPKPVPPYPLFKEPKK